MNIALAIEQHRRALARGDITRAAVELAGAADPAAVPKPGAGPLALLEWARLVESSTLSLADEGRLQAFGIPGTEALPGLRARYSGSAAWNVPLVLDFGATRLAPVCDSCEQGPCVCLDGPHTDHEPERAGWRPRLEPRSEADEALLVAAGYAPCPGNGCRDWFLPRELIEGKCAACYCAEQDPDPEWLPPTPVAPELFDAIEDALGTVAAFNAEHASLDPATGTLTVTFPPGAFSDDQETP